MKINTIKRIWVRIQKECFEYKLKDIQYCCGEMQNVFNEDLMVYAENEGEFDNYINCICVAKERHSYGDTFTDYFKIKFCPFCGEEIEINTEEINISDIRNEIVKLNEIRDEYKKRLEYSDISQKIKEIDKLIREKEKQID